jgi:asparagine synthetase B (glutamine-hydrolysing)
MCGISAVLINIPVKFATDTNDEIEQKEAENTIKSSASKPKDSAFPLSVASAVQYFQHLCEANLFSRGPDVQSTVILPLNSSSFLLLTGSVLHLRGDLIGPTKQPIVSSSGNFLCWNGEIFGGEISVGEHDNDTQQLYNALQSIDSKTEEPAAIYDVFNSIEGPFAFLYYHAKSQTLYYGRDKQGRRSLLLSNKSYDPSDIPSAVSNLTIMSSVSLLDNEETAKFHCSAALEALEWEELCTTGIFSINFSATSADSHQSVHHFWPHILQSNSKLPAKVNSQLCRSHLVSKDILQFPRVPAVLSAENQQAIASQRLITRETVYSLNLTNIYEKFLHFLSLSVRRRVISAQKFDKFHSRIGILFSGGIDCTLLARLADLNCAENENIDLINCCFAGDLAENSVAKYCPDRATAINSYLELKALNPRRNYRLILISIRLSDIEQQKAHIIRLLRPQATIMDFNISTVLWFAARGRGRIYSPEENSSRFITSEFCRYQLDYSHLHSSHNKREKIEGKQQDAEERESVGEMGIHEEIKQEKSKMSQPALSSRPETKPESAESPESSADGQNAGQSKPRSSAQTNPLHGYRWNRGDKKLKYQQQRAEEDQRKKLAELKQKESVMNQAKSAEEEEEIESTPGLADYIQSAENNLNSENSTELYTSHARILLVGIGADEQLAGYGRHKTTYRKQGLAGLNAELERDCKRLWKRNLGRDDRIVSDSSREARHPYLDEQFIELISSLRLDDICNLDLAAGIGDKQILRIVSAMCGLNYSSSLVKRAMQFGSRIANRKVAGYVAMNNCIEINQIVNPLFLHPSNRPQQVKISDELNKKKTKHLYDRRKD